MNQEQIIIKRKALEILDKNEGFIVKNFPIDNKYYSVKPFLVGEENEVAKFYLDDYINSMVVSCTPKTEVAIRSKLKYILEQQEKYGLSYWKVQDDNGEIVGITGLTYDEDEYEITFISKKPGLFMPLINYLYNIFFNEIGIEKIIAYNLSYNTSSHALCKNIGMMPNNYVMKDDYVKDDYLTCFFETREMFNKHNNSLCKTRFSSRLNHPLDFHPNARKLSSYINTVKDNTKLDYLTNLSLIIKDKFPKNVVKDIFGLI